MSLFCFPCSNSVAYDHYLNTVKKELTIADISDVVNKTNLDDIVDNVGNSFRLWGVVPGENNLQSWGQLNPGDIVVFYRKHKIIASCKVKYKISNKDIALKFWDVNDDNQTWELLVFLESFEERDIICNRANGENIIYQGFTRIVGDKDRIEELLGMTPTVIGPVQNPPQTLQTQSTLYGIINKALTKHSQVVLTGAPGTGKTYGALDYVGKNINNDSNRYRFIQFHPSYDYSDFVEGLRPIILEGSSEEDPTFVRLDGTFKSFCRMIVEKNFNEKTKKNCSDFSFEDFKDKYKELEKNNKFQTKYFMVIDEINRADLSKVFGELMFGLETSYRGISNPVGTQYKKLITYQINKNGRGEPLDFDVFKEGFFVPTNLYIIGTMNDIDKSVEAFDFALRRRFEWVEIRAGDVSKQSLKDMYPNVNQTKIDNLCDAINKMNEVISDDDWRFGLSDSYHIGHAYFKGLDFDNPDSLRDIFEKNIVPLLKEYTRGRDPDAVNKFIEKCATELGIISAKEE